MIIELIVLLPCGNQNSKQRVFKDEKICGQKISICINGCYIFAICGIVEIVVLEMQKTIITKWYIKQCPPNGKASD